MDRNQSLHHPCSEPGSEIEIEGLFNVRCFGGYSSILRPKSFTRHGLIYRSGHLRNITSRGIEQLHSLKVSIIVNLTTEGELAALFSATSPEPRFDGMKIINLPLLKGGFSVQQLVEKYRGYLTKGEQVRSRDTWKLSWDAYIR
jgi:hypothetical protein